MNLHRLIRYLRPVPCPSVAVNWPRVPYNLGHFSNPNLISHNERGAWAEEDIWAYEGRGNRGEKKTAWWAVSWSVPLTKYFSDVQLKTNEMGGACGKCSEEERRGSYRGLVGKPEGNKPLGRPRHTRWIILKQIFKSWYRGMDWINLTQSRVKWRVLVKGVMNHRVPKDVGNFLARWGRISFSRRNLLHGVRSLFLIEI